MVKPVFSGSWECFVLTFQTDEMRHRVVMATWPHFYLGILLSRRNTELVGTVCYNFEEQQVCRMTLIFFQLALIINPSFRPVGFLHGPGFINMCFCWAEGAAQKCTARCRSAVDCGPVDRWGVSGACLCPFFGLDAALLGRVLHTRAGVCCWELAGSWAELFRCSRARGNLQRLVQCFHGAN